MTPQPSLWRRCSSAFLWLVASLGLTIATDTAHPQQLIGPTHLWTYEQTSDLDGVPWAHPAYDDSAWPAGPALLGVEGNPAVGTINTPLSLGRITYYFRAHFNFSGNPASTSLILTTRVDDAAAFYLNGIELLRLRLPPGPLTYATLASSSAPGQPGQDATVDEVFFFCASDLLVGDNLLAVEVHQVSAASSDIVFGATLHATAASPVISQQPADTTVLECRTATFSVEVQGSSSFTFQWFRNGVAVPGATSPTYTTPPVTLADNATLYFVRIIDACGNVDSRQALLTVVPDIEPPMLIAIAADCANGQVCVTFNETVDPLTAEDPLNYVVDGVQAPLTAALQPDGRTVCLLFDSPFAPGEHLLEECNVFDCVGNVRPCSQLSFVCESQCELALACPDDLTVFNDTGACSTVVTYDPGVISSCGSATVICSPPSGFAFATGTTPVTCVATDAAGNTAYCSFVVTVIDQEPPPVTVSQNSTIDFNSTPPSYTGDPNLLPYLTYDKSGGTTADKWKAIINVGPRKLVIKSGAVITTTTVPATSNNRRAPGIVILAAAEEIEAGGGVVVTSVNQPAGDIFIQTTSRNQIDGIIRNEVVGTLGRPGAISVVSGCGGIVTGPASRIETLGVDPGGNNINLVTCQPGGNIFLSGLVRAMHKMGITPTINICSFAGTVTIDGNNDLGQETINGGIIRATSGVQVRTVNATSAGMIRIQAQGDITVWGNRILDRNRTQYGAVAIKSLNSNGQGGSGLMDVRSVLGQIIGRDRAFDFENRFNGLNKIQLLAASHILLGVTALINDGATDNTKAVVSTQGGSAGKGGINVLRAYSGGIGLDLKAQVLANFIGTPGVVGNNLFSSCSGNLILGVVNPSPVLSTSCSPPTPDPLFNSGADFGLTCP